MKCVVTGGAGFIGSNLVSALVDRGDEATVVDNLVAGDRADRRVPQASYRVLDITDTGRSLEVFSGIEIVFHLAALPRVQYSIEYPEKTMLTNVIGTSRVLEAAHKFGVRRVVYAASSSAYGDQEKMPLQEEMAPCPKSPYALQKYIGEQLCKLWKSVYGLGTVSLRFFNVYGPLLDPDGEYALVIGKFLKQKRAGIPLSITGDGEQTRDFTHVSDVVRAILLAAESTCVGNGEVINIAAGRGVSINNLARLFDGPTVYIPARLEPRHSRADISKAKHLLGWEPKIRLEDGIADLIRRNA